MLQNDVWVKSDLNTLGYNKTVILPCLNIDDTLYIYFSTKYTVQDRCSYSLE